MQVMKAASGRGWPRSRSEEPSLNRVFQFTERANECRKESSKDDLMRQIH